MPTPRRKRPGGFTTSSATAAGCGIRSSAPRTCASRPASSTPAASSSAHDSSAPAWAGPSPAQRTPLLRAQQPLRGLLGATSRQRHVKGHLTMLSSTRWVVVGLTRVWSLLAGAGAVEEGFGGGPWGRSIGAGGLIRLGRRRIAADRWSSRPARGCWASGTKSCSRPIQRRRGRTCRSLAPGSRGTSVGRRTRR